MGAGGQEGHGGADQLLDPADVLHRRAGQVLPGAGALGAVGPALDLLVDRDQAGLVAQAGGQVVEGLAVEGVAGADLQGLDPVEDVQLGQDNALDAADADGLTDQGRVGSVRHGPGQPALLPQEAYP